MKPRVVILGGGFGGAYCAQALDRAVRKDLLDVTVIDRNNYFVFTPLLVEAGTGSLHPRHAVVSIRSFTGACTFRMGEITGIDTDARTISYQGIGSEEDEIIPYDQLVISLGSVSRQPPVSGLREHGYEIKSLGDAVALRDHTIGLLEMADAEPDKVKQRALLHLVVVGGNFTGVEVAGEFHVFMRQACRTYPNLDPEDCKVTLVEISERILPALDADLSAYAARKMNDWGIDVLLNSTAQAIEKDGVVLHEGRRLAAKTTIWCAGIAPNPLLAGLNLPANDLGYILCDTDLSVRALENVWAIGDCAVNIDPGKRAYPATAQHAVRQGAHLARNICRVSAGRKAVPFVYNPLGSLVALGCRTGVAKIFGIKVSGFTAWFLWRTVYLFKMPGLVRKVRLALDWTLDLLFKKDFVQLGVHRTSKPMARGERRR